MYALVETTRVRAAMTESVSTVFRFSTAEGFCVQTKRQTPAPSRETNTEVTKTAIHWLATRGWLQKVNIIDDISSGSAHFELQKSSSETYGWRHGHYGHFFSSLWFKSKQ